MRVIVWPLTLILLLSLAAVGGASSSDTARQNDGQGNFASGDTPTPRLRIALIGFAHANATAESAVAETLNRDARVVLVDPSMIKPALVGVGYDGSINLSKDEARRLGAAVGCDFFIIGKSEILTRSERENESHEVAYAGVLIVDGRTGELVFFDFVSEKAATREAASSGLLRTLASRGPGYVDRMIEHRRSMAKRLQESRDSRPLENIEDLPAEDSLSAVGFTTPEFLNRPKPEFPTEAEQADITATVELMAVFRSNGEVGAIEVSRWAGFGLDESAARAVRQLKFRPATREGKPVTVRGLIRYNFRRNIETAAKPEPIAPKQPDKPERDLRQLFKPSYRRP